MIYRTNRTYRSNRTYKTNRIYLDYAASTPVAPGVLREMLPYFSKYYGNPSSLHSFGQTAMAAVDKARETIAKAIGVSPAGGFREIIFTGSATEANNLALRGVVRGLAAGIGIVGRFGQDRYNPNYDHISCHNQNLRPRFIISAIEHESILETTKDLEREGIEAVYLPVDRDGFVALEKLKEMLNERTILVSIMYANNEIGTVQNISKISEIVRNFRNENSKFKIQNSKLPAVYPLVHTDAVQAFQYLDCDVQKLGVDLMTLSAHKIYGPKGIGMLYINSKFKFKIQNSKLQFISPIVTGGGQEFNLRSGTENVPNIIGFAKATELVSNSRQLEKKRVESLRNYFWKELKKNYSSAKTNPDSLSALISSNQQQSAFLPNILNVYFPDHQAEDLLIKFDLAGIAVSSGSACSIRSSKPSHVLQALGFTPARTKNSLRFSFGRYTTKSGIKEVLKRIKKLLK